MAALCVLVSSWLCQGAEIGYRATLDVREVTATNGQWQVWGRVFDTTPRLCNALGVTTGMVLVTERPGPASDWFMVTAVATAGLEWVSLTVTNWGTNTVQPWLGHGHLGELLATNGVVVPPAEIYGGVSPLLERAILEADLRRLASVGTGSAGLPPNWLAVSNDAVTAYGWGNHATNGYLTAESDTNALYQLAVHTGAVGNVHHFTGADVAAAGGLTNAAAFDPAGSAAAVSNAIVLDVQLTNNVTVAASANTTTPFNFVYTDVYGGWSTASYWYTFPATVTGHYFVSASARPATNDDFAVTIFDISSVATTVMFSGWGSKATGIGLAPTALTRVLDFDYTGGVRRVQVATYALSANAVVGQAPPRRNTGLTIFR